ncbi:hypothetical protein B0H12DRAFT_1102409, partial [Mycena haematopus]
MVGHVVPVWNRHAPQTSVGAGNQLAMPWIPASIANGSTVGPAPPGSQLLGQMANGRVGSAHTSLFKS